MAINLNSAVGSRTSCPHAGETPALPECILFFLLMLFGATAQAARICVPSSFDGSCNSSQATIAAAITAATSGVDNIYVQAATYSERITISKNITILSASGSGSTTIQGDNTNNPVVTFTSTAVLDGFTIDNQYAGGTLSRGIYIGTAGIAPTIQNATIQGNYTPNSTDGGGGIYIVDASATLTNVTVRANTALNRSGCGIYIKSTATGTSSLTISNSTIGGAASGDGNLCTNGWGGGIYYTVASGGAGTLSISNSNIQYNQGNSGAGGVYANNITNGVTISNTSFQNNFTGTNGDGGGIYVLSSQIGINGNVISNNSARGGTGIYAGAGGVVTLGSSSSVTLDNNDTNNNTSGDGGGIYVTGAGASVTMTGGSITNGSGRYGAGLYVGASATASLTDVTITSNACAGTCATGSSNGGAISMAGSSLTVTRGMIRGNSALNGGGLYASAGTTTLYNSDITGNVATTDGGGAMVTGATTLNVYNSTVAGNYAGSASNGGGGIRNNSATLNITDGIVYGNTSAAAGKQGISTSGTTNINYSSYQAISGTCTSCANNRAVGEDPLLVNLQQAGAGAPTTAGDFHLTSSSPVINQGTNNGYTPDIDGDSRPQGAGYEMGSDEYVPAGSNNTTVGAATAVNAGAFYINVSMPYTDDANGNNTYTVDYKLSSAGGWTNWVTAAAHVATPYATTITGLTQGESYDVRVTYNDADGVTGTNPQTITGIVTAPIIRAVPGTYATLQAAIDASNNGDTVQAANGTYSENINFNGKLVTVVSQNGAALTKIQGTGSNNPVVTFGSGETSSAVLDGFTIDNQAAAGTNSSGIKITAASAPMLQNLIVEGNGVQAGYYGGGIYINGGTATVQNSTLGTSAKPNTAGARGGALYATALSAPLSVSNTTVAYNTSLDGGAVYLAANGAQTTTFTTVTFSDNSSTNHGGAIYNDTSKLTVTGSAFNTNTTGANMNGGAIVITGTTASASISNTTFTSNTSDSYGGAIYLTGSTEASPLTISGSTFTSNGTGGTTPLYGGAIALNTVTNATVISSTTLTGGSATNRGGGIYATSAPLTLTSVNVTSNTSNLEGGGMYLVGATTIVNMTGGSVNSNTGTNGGGIYITGATLNTYSGAAISSNTASSTIGGGISINSSSTVTMSKTTISGNRANQRGGGIAMAATGGSVLLTNCNITGNSADMQAYSNGGGIYDAGGTITLMNTTVAGNYATQSAGGFAAAGADDVITNSIFWGNTAGATPEISGTPTITYSDVSGGFAGTGNINNDPLFVTLAQASSGNPTTSGNFHLQSTSPAKNVGTATGAPSDDIDGDSRSSVDMGSDEYIGAASITVSGTLYSDEGTAAITTGPTVRLIANGASVGTAAANGSGVYSITASVNSGDALIAYIDSDGGAQGNAVTVSNGANLSGLNIYQNRAITRHDNGGSLTNALMSTAKGAYSDTDILYSVDGSNNLTVSGANTELFVWSGHTFAPGATVTTKHMDVRGTFNPAANAVNISGNWNVDAAATFTTSGTVTFSGTNQSISGSATFNNLTKSVAAAATLTFAAGSTTTVNGIATLNGASGQLLSLVSSSPGTYWSFTLGAASTKTISYVSVTDSDASGSDAAKKPISPANSNDGGHNLSWFVPSLIFLKTVAVTSDPFNGGTNPKYIPGAEALFTMRVTNSGAGTVDNNTLIITDPIPANAEVFTGDLSGGAPFMFVDGTPSSALSCAFIALGNLTDCIDFSNDGGSTWTFVPNGSFDPAVTNIRFSLSGTMNGTGGGSPYFDLSFRVRIK